MTLPRAIICEIDGVLSDDRHRRHFIDPEYALKIPNSPWIRVHGFGSPLWRHEGSASIGWEPDLDSYHAAAIGDEPNRVVWSILQYDLNQHGWSTGEWGEHLCPPAIPLFITQRPERNRSTSERWIASQNISPFRLFMRPDFLPEQAHAKREIFEREIAGKYDVLFVIESDDECIEMYRSIGLTCLKLMFPLPNAPKEK